jgi:poly-gamma-glutamate capsule biosynthesis protein CapA/YwtB (metallophosphatase superfamily)
MCYERVPMNPSALRLTVLGQALIQHDLRAHPWPDFAVLAAMFARADVCFTDLESAIHSPFAEAPTREGVFLHAADPVVLDCLKDLSISLLATANNHAWDLGNGGIIGALGELEARGFAHAGSGIDLAAAGATAYRRTENGTVALVAMASGAIREGAAATATRAGINELRRDADGALGTADLSRIFGAIAEAMAQADVVLACHHNHILEAGGRQTPQWQRAFARQCIDAGASLYVGHSAPRLQGIELYRERPIFYDLGSLIFQTATEEGFYDDAVWQSVIAECRFVGGCFREMTLTPVQLNPQGIGGPGDLATRGRPSIARGTEANAILDRLAELSRPFGTALERSGETTTIFSPRD